MRRAFARVGAARRLVASRLFQLAKINGRLKELRPLSQSRLLSGPNNAFFGARQMMRPVVCCRARAALAGATLGGSTDDAPKEPPRPLVPAVTLSASSRPSVWHGRAAHVRWVWRL